MPIKGLTDINRPPRQGMLRLGIKKKTKAGVEYPVEVDYFILDPETPDPEEKKRLIDLFHKTFGDKPKTIAIRLISSDINKVFPQNYKRYGKNTSLKCIGDGETATVTEEQFANGLKIIGKDKETNLTIVECKGRGCVFAVTNEEATNKECKATATLSVDIWPLGGMGVWQVTTGSFYSIVTINSCIREITNRYGRAHALPLLLERRPQETTYKGRKTTHYTLHINTDKSIQEMVREAQIAPERVLIEAYGKELPSPVETMDDAVGEAIEEAIEVHAEKTGAEVPDPIEEAVEIFDGTIIENEGEEKFLEGLKKDAKEELGVQTIEKPEEEPTRIQSPQNRAIEYPDNFWEFVTFCKRELKAAGMEDLYTDTLYVYSIKVLSDLKDDLKKQEDFRRYLEGVMEKNLYEGETV